MIPPASRNGVIILSALLVVTVWAARHNQAQDIAPTAGLDTRLDYALTRLELSYYDEEGQPAVFMSSPRYTSDAASGVGRITEPRMEVHHDGQLWNIIADTATVTQDREFIHLSGTVQLRRYGPDPDGWLRLDGSEVTLEVTPRIARSERYVELNEASNRLTATGFRVNMKDDRFELIKNVEGNYVIQ